MFTTIVSVDNKWGIGKENKIPWRNAEDMKFFKDLTVNNVVIMGSTTFSSIGKLLPNRINIVISRKLTAQIEEKKDLLIFNDLWACVRHCNKEYFGKDRSKKVYVIGGSEIYKWFLENGLVGEEIITFVNHDFECDKFYTNYENQHAITSHIRAFKDISASPTTEANISTHVYSRKHLNAEEFAVLNTMRSIATAGEDSADRTGIGAKYQFGLHFQFDLSNNTFPLMTTRKLGLKGPFEELMLYLRGDTDSKKLEEKGINVWKPNTTRAFLDSRGLTNLPEGDMGHSYGFSFRHFGAEYVDCNTEYAGQGYDQLMELIKEIRTNPHSRRLIISLWEPNHMHKAALPPCLFMYQFNVCKGVLSCIMTQRSSDMFTAAGWNIATGSLLTIMLAHVCELTPGKLIWNIGNGHIYNNLIAQTLEQTGRQARPFPKMLLKNAPKDILAFEYKHFELLCYDPHPPIETIINV